MNVLSEYTRQFCTVTEKQEKIIRDANNFIDNYNKNEYQS